MSDALKRDVRYLKGYAFGSTLLLVLLIGTAFQDSGSDSESRSTRFEEVTAERLNIVGPNDTTRIVLSNKKRFPPPVLNGDTIRARSISPAGMTFYDEDGNEVGGVAVVNARGAERAALILDYANSEAIGLGKTETEDGYETSISIADRLPLSANPREVGTVGAERISLANENGTAEVVLKDGQERPRIRLAVEERGAPRIELLDEDGNVIDALTTK